MKSKAIILLTLVTGLFILQGFVGHEMLEIGAKIPSPEKKMMNIDDNVKRSDEVKKFYLRDALNNLASGNTINPEITRQLGCSIKRK